VDKGFTFRTGKYAGKTYGWVEDNAPDYLIWIKENRPEMLVAKKIIPKITKEVPDFGYDYKLPNNLNFDNEPPSEYVIEYKKKNNYDSK